MRRTLRASHLLRFVSPVLAVLIVWAVWALFHSLGWTLIALGVGAALWFVGIELDLLSLLIEQLATSHARRKKLTESIWFDDVRRQRSADREEFTKQTSDNPTLR